MTGSSNSFSQFKKVGSPPPLPSSRAVVYDCITGQCHKLGRSPLTFGTGDHHDISLGALATKDSLVTLERSGKRLRLSFEGGGHEIQVNGKSFEGGLLPQTEQLSLVIDKAAFFFIATGEDCDTWAGSMQKSGRQRWILHIFNGGTQMFQAWQTANMPTDFPGKHTIEDKTMLELIDEIGRRSWEDQVGIVYNALVEAKACFFAAQFRKLSALFFF